MAVNACVPAEVSSTYACNIDLGTCSSNDADPGFVFLCYICLIVDCGYGWNGSSRVVIIDLCYAGFKLHAVTSLVAQ